jgi:hypothetical protein
LRVLDAFKSAASAFFGVQNSKQHQQDFDAETPFPFILAGVILAVGLVLLLVGIVNLVI